MTAVITCYEAIHRQRCTSGQYARTEPSTCGTAVQSAEIRTRNGALRLSTDQGVGTPPR